MIKLEAITQDPDIAKKIGMGSVLALVPFGFIPLAGWMLAAVRNYSEDEDAYLPAFDDIGTLASDGTKVIGLFAIWFSPMVLLTIIASIVPIIAAGMPSGDDAMLLIIAAVFCLALGIILFAIPASLLSIGGLGYYAETGDFAGALQPKRLFAIFKANPGGTFVAMLINGFLRSALTTIGMMLCFIGMFPAITLSLAISSQLYGKAYRDGKANLRLGDASMDEDGDEDGNGDSDNQSEDEPDGAMSANSDDTVIDLPDITE